VRRPALVAILLLGACARSNEDLLRDLERPEDPRTNAVLSQDAVPIAGEARATTLPMRGRLPTVDGTVNGVEMPLVIDTGSSHVRLAGPAARDARVVVPRRDAVRMLSPGRDVPHRLAVFESLGLGKLRFGPGVATIALREGADRRGGIVGCSVLSHFRVTFDFQNDELRLEPHGRPGYTEPLWTKVAVNGRTYWLMIDSGATRVMLEPWAARELDLISEERAARHLAGKASDETVALYTRVRLETVEVAGRRFREVAGGVVYTFGDEPSREGIRPGGLLGLKIFGRLAWTLDFGAKRLTVQGG